MTWEFKKCCGCVDLRIGSLIIGYLHLCGGILVFIGSVILFVDVLRHPSPNKVPAGLLGANVVLMFMSALFTVGLLFGIHKYQHKYIQPYLIYNSILVIFHAVDLTVNAIFGVVVVNIVSNILSILITIYFLLVIRSYWLELKRSGNPMAPAQVYAPPLVYPTPPGYPGPVNQPGTVPVTAVVYTDQPAQKQAFQDV